MVAIQVLHKFVVAETDLFVLHEVVDIVWMEHKARMKGE
jgi:hypothetical protein